MTDSIDTSEREAEEPRGPFNLPIREMRAEPVPHQPADPLRAALQLALEATPEQLPTALRALAEQPAVAAALGREAARHTVIGWLVSNSEGDDEFVNNPSALKGRHYKGHEPVPLFTAAPTTEATQPTQAEAPCSCPCCREGIPAPHEYHLEQRTMASQQQAVQGEPVKRVYLVATGELHEGEETYTRHDDAPPPLCDAECLYTANPPATGQVERAREDALPPLPDPVVLDSYLSHRLYEEIKVEGFTADQMEDYARAAIRAARSSKGGAA
jgi:hypothetical protein